MSTSKWFRSGSKTLLEKRAIWPNKITSIELPERFKGTIVEKWANYWKNLLRDYKEVILDTGRNVKEKPVRSLIYGGLLSSVYLFSKNNPDLITLNEKLRSYTNTMILVNEDCRNKTTSNYLIYIERCLNEGVLRRISVGVVSFLWIDNYNESLAIYKSVCPHLKPNYSTFYERIVDIGFWNSWRKLDKLMIDYDINEE